MSAEADVVITRIIGAPRELVFKAWTAPEHVIHWWGPKGFTVPVCEMDVRPAGTYRIHMRSPEGVEYPLKGVYRAVVEPVRIVASQNWDENREEWKKALGKNVTEEAVLTVTFEETDGKTKLTLHTRFESIAARDAMLNARMVAGWHESLQRLEEHLAKA